MGKVIEASGMIYQNSKKKREIPHGSAVVVSLYAYRSTGVVIPQDDFNRARERVRSEIQEGKYFLWGESQYLDKVVAYATGRVS